MAYSDRQVSRHRRGLGWRHVQQRNNLLAKLIDGEPCWWCGRPMSRDQELAADHSQPRSKGGVLADRLLHAACNMERGDGRRDHQRPALHGGRKLWLEKGSDDNGFDEAAHIAERKKYTLLDWYPDSPQ